jgi:hypothetical protein
VRWWCGVIRGSGAGPRNRPILRPNLKGRRGPVPKTGPLGFRTSDAGYPGVRRGAKVCRAPDGSLRGAETGRRGSPAISDLLLHLSPGGRLTRPDSCRRPPPTSRRDTHLAFSATLAHVFHRAGGTPSQELKVPMWIDSWGQITGRFAPSGGCAGAAETDHRPGPASPSPERLGVLKLRSRRGTEGGDGQRLALTPAEGHPRLPLSRGFAGRRPSPGVVDRDPCVVVPEGGSDVLRRAGGRASGIVRVPASSDIGMRRVVCGKTPRRSSFPFSTRCAMPTDPYKVDVTRRSARRSHSNSGRNPGPA